MPREFVVFKRNLFLLFREKNIDMILKERCVFLLVDYRFPLFFQLKIILVIKWKDNRTQTINFKEPHL